MHVQRGQFSSFFPPFLVKSELFGVNPDHFWTKVWKNRPNGRTGDTFKEALEFKMERTSWRYVYYILVMEFTIEYSQESSMSSQTPLRMLWRHLRNGILLRKLETSILIQSFLDNLKENTVSHKSPNFRPLVPFLHVKKFGQIQG